jgi:uncharacterized protein YgiM (DUF1202 family)
MSQYGSWIQKLRAALGSSKVITMSVVAGSPGWASEVLANSVQGSIDQFNVMCYDSDIWSGLSWYNQALIQGSSGWSEYAGCDEMTKGFTDHGVAPGKMGMGMPFYERKWTGNSAPMQPKGGIVQYNYNQMVNDYGGNPELSSQWVKDTAHQSEYLSAPGPTFIPFAGEYQMQSAVQLMKNRGYGGLMTFTTNYEYLPNASGDARWPLSTAIFNAMGGVTPPPLPTTPPPPGTPPPPPTTTPPPPPPPPVVITIPPTTVVGGGSGTILVPPLLTGNPLLNGFPQVPTTPVPPPVNTSLPIVFLASPTYGQTLSGTVSISAQAGGASPISMVNYYVDGVLVGSATKSPYTVTWNSKSVADGYHIVGVSAVDTSGRVGVASPAIVIVSNTAAPVPPPVPAPVPAPSTTPGNDSGGPFAIGSRVSTTATVNIRSSADLTPSNSIGTAQKGSQATVIGGPVQASGYTWIQVRYDNGQTGWTASSYLIASSGQGTGGTTPPPAPTPAPSAAFTAGDRLISNTTVNVRSAPGTSSSVLGVQSSGMGGTVIGGPVVSGGYTWWHINYDSGADGWTAQPFLAMSSGVTPTPPSATPPPPSGIPPAPPASGGSTGSGLYMTHTVPGGRGTP